MTEMELPKGVRDFLPKEKIIRNYIVNTLTQVFEEFGFNPIETPAVELLSVITAKGGNEPGTDAYEELYKFEDRAGRKLGLKFEQTFALARVIAMNPQLPRPFKRYQIDRAWRDGPTKVGRYKEFWQCDIDTIGSESMAADAEILAVFTSIFEKLKLRTVTKLGNRKLLNGVLEDAGVPEKQREEMIIVIDKLEKMSKEEMLKEAAEKKINTDQLEEAIQILSVTGSNEEKISKLMKKVRSEQAKQGLTETKQLIEYAEKLGAKDIEFIPSLARGLTYYTGPVFEVFLKSGKIKSSLAGGGRWDDMIGKFIGTDKIIPATGVGIGLDTIYDAFIAEEKADLKETVVQAFVIPIKTLEKSLEVARKLREAGIKTDIDLMDRGPSKNLNYVNAQSIPYAVIIGPKEAASGEATVKDMKTGEEQKIGFEKIADFLSKKLGK